MIFCATVVLPEPVPPLMPIIIQVIVPSGAIGGRLAWECGRPGRICQSFERAAGTAALPGSLWRVCGDDSRNNSNDQLREVLSCSLADCHDFAVVYFSADEPGHDIRYARDSQHR